MKVIKPYLFLFIYFILIFFFPSCKRDREVAVITNDISSITVNTAKATGRIFDEGKSGVTQYGHCWDTNSSPTINNNKTELGNASGRLDFTSNLINLSLGTKYYVRAYAKDGNNNEIVYGEEINFTTSSTIGIPSLTTTAATSITLSSAISGGDISSDGGATITARGVCWSTSTNPTTTSSHTTNGTGTGSFTSSLTTLTATTLYYVRAYATNSIGTSYGNQISFTTTSSGFNCGTSTVTDYDGNSYNTVLIGTQCWMKENLKATHYSNGTALLDGTSVGDITGNYASKYYFDYANTPSFTTIYGKLYTWAAVMNGAASSVANPSGVQGVCPTGWHLPSDAEWTQLTDYLGGESVAGGKMKDAGLTYWNSPNTGADNSSGFTGLPGGFRSYIGTFSNVVSNGYWWSATESDGTNTWARYLYYDSVDVSRNYYNKAFGNRVRCLRD
jgi:uncharacterized protein (TIGR02145 family)